MGNVNGFFFKKKKKTKLIYFVPKTVFSLPIMVANAPHSVLTFDCVISPPVGFDEPEDDFILI